MNRVRFLAICAGLIVVLAMVVILWCKPDEGEPVEGEGEIEPGEEVTVMLPGDVPLVLVYIPAGTFMMGRYPGEQDSYEWEDPHHEVTLSQGFYMGKYEVTQQQWRAVMGMNHSRFTGDTLPVERVSWDDIQGFMTALNAHITTTGQGPATVRLPSEAEWEYACRAGTTTRFYWGDDPEYTQIGDYAWYWDNNDPYGTKPVGGKLPNAFGLYDMSGNVWEWCEDDWHSNYTGAPADGSAWVDAPRGSYRVLRGGRWINDAFLCRAAARHGSTPDARYDDYGFRVARTLAPEPEGEGEPVEGEPVEGEPAEGEPVEGEGEIEPGEEVTVMLPGDVPLVLVYIPAGTFMMGRYSGEQDSYSDEDPQHSVTLSQGFYMGKYELTKRQWQAVMGTTPWSGRIYVLNDLDSPAVYVSWNNAQSFVTALNAHITSTGQGAATVRLPSEAEWEYAARAGTTTRFYWGDDPSYTQIGDYAWYSVIAWDAGEQYAHVVGLKLPNAFGLYDMSGNVWEWCEDDWHWDYNGAPTNGSAWVDSPRGDYRVLRGGGWRTYALYCRAASRSYFTPVDRFSFRGFRVARTP